VQEFQQTRDLAAQLVSTPRPARLGGCARIVEPVGVAGVDDEAHG
jgi:hypothetical protein